MKDKKLLPKHIWQIVHIFDTDGAYVPDTAIMKGGTKEFMYSPTCISCKNVQSVLDRNKRKSNRSEEHTSELQSRTWHTGY